MIQSDRNTGVPGDALTAPAVARNREPILAVLRRILPAEGLVLEIASGTGEHAVHLASALPAITWQPSDRDADALASIAAHRRLAGVPNLLEPVRLDAAASSWPVMHADALVAINMVHISPWAATQGLFAGAARILGPDGLIYLYGPYDEAERPMAESNAAFDRGLRERDAGWGIRRLGDVTDLAADHGFRLAERIDMPANNLSLAFRREI